MKYTQPRNFILEQQEMEQLRATFAPLSRESPQDKKVEFNFTKKEEPKMTAYSVDVAVSAEGLKTFITDLQEMNESTKYKRDAAGNRVMGEDGNYMMVTIPLTERWVSVGEIKWNGEKFVIRTNIDTLNNMEAMNARKARIASYQNA